MALLDKKKVLIGILTFIYFAVPVIQYHLYSNIEDRFNDHYVFCIAQYLFEFLQFVYTNSIVPYLAQILIWLFAWWLINKIVYRGNGHKFPRKPATNHNEHSKSQ